MHGQYSTKKPEPDDVIVIRSEVAKPGASHLVKALRTFNPPVEIKDRLAMRIGTVMAGKLTVKNAHGENMRLGNREKAAHREFFVSAVNAGLPHEGWKAAKEAEGVVSRRDAGISSIRRRAEGDFGRRQGQKLANDAHAIIQVVRAYGITERDGLPEIIQDLIHSRKYNEAQRDYLTDLVGGYLHARSREAISKKRLSPPENRMPEEKIHDAPVSLLKAKVRRVKPKAAGNKPRRNLAARAKRR